MRMKEGLSFSNDVVIFGLFCLFMLRLGRQRGFLLSVGLSSLCGVIVCLSRSLVAFLLMRLFQGATLAGVFVSSYIASKFPGDLNWSLVSKEYSWSNSGSSAARIPVEVHMIDLKHI